MHTLAIVEQGAAVHAAGDLVAVQRGASVLRRSPAAELDQLLLFGHVEITSSAIALLLRRGVDVAWLTLNGRFRGRLLGRATKNVALRLAQYRRTADETFCVRLATTIVAAKIRQQRQLLLRAQRRLREEPLAVAVGRLRLLAANAERATTLDVLRGIEGAAAATYFGQFNALVLNDAFRFHGRSRRPPRDELNSLLSFGYAVLGSTLETELYRCGLDPLLGFYHQPAYGRASLMLDLLEQWRPTLDAVVLRIVNRRQLSPGDFEHRTSRQLDEILNEKSPPPAAEFPVGEPDDDDDEKGDEKGDENDDDDENDPPWDEPDAAPPDDSNGAVTPGAVRSTARHGTAESAQAPDPTADAAESELGVYLGDMARRVFLNEILRRLRERIFYPPHQARFELRDILREQIYHLARVLEDKEERYMPFIPE